MTRLASLLKVRPGESRLVVLLMLVFLLPNLGGASGSPGVEALFFSRFGVENLPFIYIAMGLTAMVVTVLLAGMLGRTSKKRLYLALPVVMGLVLIFSRLVVSLDLTWFYFVLWLNASTNWTLQGLFTWGLAGMVCDTRQAKRLFPLFGAGGIFGLAVGGFVTQPLVGLIGTENLLWVWAAALLATAGVVSVLLRDAAEPKRPKWRKVPGLLDGMLKGYDYVRRTRLMRWISVTVILLALLFFSLAFPVARAIAAEFPTEDEISGFIGLFNGIITVVAFLGSLFISNRIFARIGFIRALLIFGLIYLLGFGVMLTLTGFPAILAASGFIAIITFRFFQAVWREGVAITAMQALFNIVPESRREQTRTFINGFPFQIGVASTGLILLLGRNDASGRFLFIVGIVSAVLCLWTLWRANQAYREALVDALQAGQPHIFYAEETPFGGFQQDVQAIETAVKGIEDPSPTIRALSAGVLGYIAGPRAGAALVRALEDFDAGVRAAALRAVARGGWSSALLDVQHLLRDPEPEVRLEAVRALSRLAVHSSGLRMDLSPMLDDSDPEVRADSAVTLLKDGDHPSARFVISQMAMDDDPQVRIPSLKALRTIDEPFIFEVTIDALGSPLPAVRSAAAELAQNYPDSCTIPLIEALDDPDAAVRASIARSLGAIGPTVLPLLVQKLKDPESEQGVLLALQHMPAKQIAGDITRFAEQKLSLADACGKHWRILEAQPGVYPGSSQKTPALALLQRSLQQAAMEQAERGLAAIGLLEDSAGMAVARENLHSEDPAQVSTALEMLDSLPQRELLKPLFYLWETGAPAPEPEGPEHPGVESVLMTLIGTKEQSNAWLCAVAMLAAREALSDALREVIAARREHPNPLVAGTARYVLAGEKMDTLDTIPMMERILYLQKVPIFKSLEPHDLKQVAAISAEHFFAAGETLVEQGEPGDEMFIIVRGEVDVVFRGEDGEEKLVARRGSGDYVGEMSIIGHEPRSASLVAREDVRALCIDKKSFEGMIRERPEVSLSLMRVLIDRLKEASR